MAEQPRQLATVRTWAELHAALRARSDEIGYDRLTLDELMGVGKGHASKLLAPIPIKNLGPKTFGDMFGALAVMALIVEDPDALKRIRHVAEIKGAQQRDPQWAACGAKRANSVRVLLNPMLLKDKGGNPLLLDPEAAKEFCQIMRARRALKTTPAQRRRIARKAARARWAKVRMAKGRKGKC